MSVDSMHLSPARLRLSGGTVARLLVLIVLAVIFPFPCSGS